jgi:heme oxygenase (biliverdin-IX-beta and delta-forming)
MSTTTIPATLTRAESLKAATHEAHQVLDHSIMKFNPFESRHHYAAFLNMQYAFHNDVAALFILPELNALFPDLAYRARLQQVQQDLADLGLPLPPLPSPAVFGSSPVDIPTALGWLYVEEGSNLGGAFLYKAAARLGFDATHGARHLAPHSEGRAPNWKAFVAQLNQIVLSQEQEIRVVAGAAAAFARVTGHVEKFCIAMPVV